MNIVKDKAAKTPQIQKDNPVSHLIDGAFSGFISGLFLQPFQVIKTAMQISPIQKKDPLQVIKEGKMEANKAARKKPLNFSEATKVIYEMEGVKGYYRGMVPGVIKASVSAGIYFGAL